MAYSHDEAALVDLRRMAATLCVDLNAYGMREFVTIHLAHEIGELVACVAKLERQLRHGKRLVHAAVEAERVLPRLVAWAGEPDQRG